MMCVTFIAPLRRGGPLTLRTTPYELETGEMLYLKEVIDYLEGGLCAGLYFI